VVEGLLLFYRIELGYAINVGCTPTLQTKGVKGCPRSATLVPRVAERLEMTELTDEKNVVFVITGDGEIRGKQEAGLSQGAGGS